MMQANELRVGNVLDVDGNYWQVSDILTDKGLLSELYFKENQEYNHLLNARPIPLTEEILLKCGFKHETMYIIRNLYLIEYGDSYFILDENNGYYHVKLSNHSFGHEKQVCLGVIKHLHQLQNLTYIISNKELEVKFK